MITNMCETRNISKLLPWSEKYRPEQINNIIYHEKITSSIIKYMDDGKLPHLLFYGPAGSGKTSTILTIAKHYYKEDFYNMIMIFNASEERGIETVRNRVKQFVTTNGLPENPSTPRFKLIILDEIDAMTEDAQATLRKVIENYVVNVRFCFICNYLKKINPAIQSRCIIFRFKPITSNYMYSYIENISEKENFQINSDAINLVISHSNGDMRKLLNILQSIYMYTNINNDKTIINDTIVSKILSCPTKNNILNILTFIQHNNFKDSYIFINNIVSSQGIFLPELINCIYSCFMDSIINDDCSIIKYDLTKSINIIKHLSVINENLVYSNNNNIQLVAFIAIFYML